MGKNYDNWERLVTAVVRLERDKQLAMTHSRDTSSISSESSTSQFDHNESPMDYHDLTQLDHHQWKTMLPPHKQQLVWRSSYMSFYLDQWTGKNSFLLGAVMLTMGSGDGLEDCWRFDYSSKSRFDMVIELTESRHLYIEGNIKTHMLSPDTTYAAYLVNDIRDTRDKLHSAVSIIRHFYDESGYEYPEEQVKIVQFHGGNDRADGWKEIELGEFFVGLEANGEVQVQVLDTSGYRKSGLIVEGIEFRPFKMKS